MRMNKLIIGAMCVMMAGAMTACGSSTTTVTTESGTTENVQIPSPYQEVSSLDEAANIAGFSITVPDAPDRYPNRIIQVIDKTMIEVLYTDKSGDADSESAEAYRIRKAVGTEDISGDSTDYSDSKTVSVGDYSVTMKGSDNKYSVATWSYEGYAYAVDAEISPLDEDAMTAIISAVK